MIVHDGIPFRQEELDLFWRFVTERHWIWHRRFILKQSSPWTDNPILQKHKFTNIYRELDPGTQYARQIMSHDAPRPDIMFNVMIYRLMCSIPTYDGWGFHRLEEFDLEQFQSYLKGLYETGQPVFGNAYLISPYSSMGSEYKYVNVARLFGYILRDFDWIWRRVDTAPSFEKAFKVLNGLYGFGPFLAYQVMVDLTYPLPNTYAKSAILPWSQDDWAKLGPGAIRGFARLSPSMQRLKGLRWLRDAHRAEFDSLGLDFPYLRNAEGEEVPLTLANLQNCLCEFHKYRSIMDGTGKAQRLYVPQRKDLVDDGN